MRESVALQRRRRLVRLQANANSEGSVPTEMLSLSALHDEHASPLGQSLEQLFRVCQGHPNRQLMIEVRGEAHPRRVELSRPFLLVGRDARCDVQIEHAGVAPFQAYLQWLDGGLFFHDLSGSVSPPTRSSAWVGQKPLVIGPLRLSLVNGESPERPTFDPLARHPDLATEIPQVQLKFAGVAQQDNLWPVDRRLTLIGRGDQCHLRLDHPAVPVVLASLIRMPSSCWLINLSGRPIVGVNNRRAVVESLDIGDTLQLGPFVAEVTTAPFSLKAPRSSPHIETASIATAARELAVRHQNKLSGLARSFKELRAILDSDQLDSVPGLKIALQQYVNQSHRLHRETQAELERLASPGETP